MTNINNNSKSRKILLWLLFIITPLGFLTKFYSGYLQNWLNNSVAGLIYVIFWCLLIRYIFIKLKPINVTVSVFLVTSLLEFTQLLKYPFLEFIRSYFIGRALIGSTFSPGDFLYYTIGAVLAFIILKHIDKFNSE